MASSNPLGRAYFLLTRRWLAAIRPASSSGESPLETAVTPSKGRSPALGLPLVSDRGHLLVLGVAPLLVHDGDDGEIIWGPVGLDIGVVRFLM